MQIILLATGETEKLRPLTDTIPAPMIPIANRPTMVYTVEMLARQGIKKMLVSLYHLGGSVEAYFGDGRRWGVEIEYVLQRDAWGSAGALKWAEHSLNDTFMVLPADLLIDLDIAAVLTQHRARQSAATLVVRADGGGEPVCLDADGRVALVETAPSDGRLLYTTGVCIFEPRILEMIPARAPFDLNRQLLPALLAADLPVQGYEVEGYWNPLSTFPNYQLAQRDSLTYTGDARHVLDGTARSLEARQIASGIWVGRNHVIHPSARLAPPIYIGDNCQIGRNVELGPNVALGKNVIIDDEATVFQSAVLEHTYVGRLVNIENRVVNKNIMIDIATAESSEIVDDFLLGEAHPALIDSGLQRMWDTAVAFLLLLLTLPLTLPVGLLAWLTTGRMFNRIERLGRQPEIVSGESPEFQTFAVLQFNTRRSDSDLRGFGKWLEKWEIQRLPELWNVLKGDMNLVGVKPLPPTAAAQITEAWQRQRHQHQAGFTGLWYIQTRPDSELDEILIADTYYVATRTWGDDLKILRQTPERWLRRARY
ncbi:MAG: NTP transferase domain-containing protein [Chloroflexi bacterium]|nr:NTP transferase domain-containing protein [Chloroflexota bacterium]